MVMIVIMVVVMMMLMLMVMMMLMLVVMMMLMVVVMMMLMVMFFVFFHHLLHQGILLFDNVQNLLTGNSIPRSCDDCSLWIYCLDFFYTKL